MSSRLFRNEGVSGRCAAAFECPGEGHFVGVLQVAAEKVAPLTGGMKLPGMP